MRPFVVEDAEAMHRNWASDKEVTRYLTWPLHETVASWHDPRNPNSGKVMQKCGMKYEGTLRSTDRNNQGICDAVCYGLLKEEWLTRQGKTV